MTEERAIGAISVGTRYRKDYGDMEGLKSSILNLGLLQPIVITPDNLLIAGARRLRACSELGWALIPVHVATTLDDLRDRLVAERDENTQRKTPTPSETVDLANAIEAGEALKAKERMAEGGRKSAPGRSAEKGVPAPADLSERGNRTRQKVADAVGMGRTTLGYAKKIVARAEAGDPKAIEAREMMDATGNIMPAYEHMIGHRVSHREREHAKRPPAPPRYGPRRTHRQVIEAMTAALDGLAIAAEEITELDASVTAEEATRLTGDLSKSLASLRRLNKLLSTEASK